MSLRDQLIAKGVASKKDARRVEQQLKEERRKAQGHKRSEAEVAAEQEALRLAAEEAVRQARLEERRRREATREALERRTQIRQVIRGNQVRSRGKVRFHHRELDGKHVGRVEVSPHVAWKLRVGDCAIAALVEEGREPEYVVVSARGAARLEELAPELVVHRVTDTTGLSAPEEGLLDAEWEISLRPHRVR